MNTIYIVGSRNEGRWLSEDRGVNERDVFVVSTPVRFLEGRRIHKIVSTRLARQHPLFESVLTVAENQRLKTRQAPQLATELDYGLRVHSAPRELDPPYAYN